MTAVVPDSHTVGYAGSKDNKQHCYDRRTYTAPCGKRVLPGTSIESTSDKDVCVPCAEWLLTNHPEKKE